MLYFLNNHKIFFALLLLFFLINLKILYSKEIYFDLSENEIKIQTDFNGKEIIIFGILEKDNEAILTIKGPKKKSRVQKKERFFGIWLNTKYIIYNNVPSIFFVASSKDIEEILPTTNIINEELAFNYILENKSSKTNFISISSQKTWQDNFVRIKKKKGLYKKFQIEKINDKLFQTRVFFPSNTIPGKYTVKVYNIKNNSIIGMDKKIINIEKSGIGSKIYYFANNNSAAYGLLVIIFAILSGLIAATLFRRL